MSYLATICESLLHAEDLTAEVEKLSDEDLRAVHAYWVEHHACGPAGLPGLVEAALIVEAGTRFMKQGGGE